MTTPIDGCTFHLIDRKDEDPLFLMLRDITPQERSRIPWGPGITMEDMYRGIAPYILDWNLRAKVVGSDTLSDIPAPGSPAATTAVGAGNEWRLLELLDNPTGSLVGVCFMRPDYLDQVSYRE